LSAVSIWLKPCPDTNRGVVVDTGLKGIGVLGFEILRARFLAPLEKARGFGMTSFKEYGTGLGSDAFKNIAAGFGMSRFQTKPTGQCPTARLRSNVDLSWAFFGTLEVRVNEI
jgi:hypothetical protein